VVRSIACGVSNPGIEPAPVDAIARQLWDLTLTFSLYPRTVFSGALSVVLYTVIPAAFVGHLPIELLREPTAAGLGAVVGGAVGYTALAWTVFRLGLRRYASGSRFVVRA
jgi:ABC-2 type transport system permease protein